MRYRAVVTWVLSLSACAGAWKKPGATAADFDRDLVACRTEARGEVTPTQRTVTTEYAGDRRETSVVVNETRTREDRNEYVDRCLEARGWRWKE